MSDAPLVATPVYGLRTWTVSGEYGDERLAGTYRDAPWPAGGAWLQASCPSPDGHHAPAPGCSCGVHAWHPRPRAARRILASRREVPGIVEARGAIEVHEDGFRAERARPYALLLAPGRNARVVHRLGEAYHVPVVEAGGPDAVLDWCSAHGLGLDEPVVAELLGPGELAARRRTRHAKVRADALRLAVAIAIAGLLVVLGQVATDPPGERVLQGRAGEIHTR
ncbi:MAG: hypothetical protein ACRDLY_15285 [Thermoleophilaceae bacterium]